MQRIWCIFFNAWSGGWPELACISGSWRCWMEEPVFVLSALWSVCGFPIAISSRHFGNFTPPARQSGKGWQGGFKYWVMRIINQGPSADFLLFFIFFVSGQWAAEEQPPVGLRLQCGCSLVFRSKYLTSKAAVSSGWIASNQEGY